MRRFLCSFDNFEADAYDFDVIIVGSGVAGLYAALHIDPALQVALVTKANIDGAIPISRRAASRR